LVTGGAGFIGSHVADRLLADGWDVHVLDDLSTGRRENLDPRVTLHENDICSAAAASLIEQGGFDAILHLAAQIDVRRSVADPLYDATVNIVGTVNILDALVRAGARARVVFSSTGGAIYGDHTTPPNAETTAKEPDSPYAIGKLASEYYLAYYARIRGLDTVSVRFANVYGPRQDPHGEAGVVAIFCGRLLEGRPLTVFGDGSQTRDYVHVSDVADACVRAIDAQLPPPSRIDARAFNIGTGVATSVLDLATALQRVTNTTAPIEHAPKRTGEQQDSFLTIAKAQSGLGWTPRMSLDAGLADTFAWFAARARAPNASPTAATPSSPR
jgi:UDP-glucose 4-epimerase